MRDFIRRFADALRTIPQRVRWMLIAPVAFIALFVINGKLAVSVFLLVLGGLVIRELFRTKHVGHQGGQSRHGDILSNHGAYDAMVTPATGSIVNGITDGSDRCGYGDRHNFAGSEFQKSAMDDYHEHWPHRCE